MDVAQARTDDTQDVSIPPHGSFRPSANDDARDAMATDAAPDARIGRVVSVAGGQVVALLDNAAMADGSALQIGALVKMRASDSTTFAIVTALSIPLPDQESPSGEVRIAELELLGEAASGADGQPAFGRGVSAFPGLGDAVLATTRQDLSIVYARPTSSAVRIGTLHQDKEVPAYVIVDELLGKHFAVLGTTGSGKSCAVSLILNSVLAQHHNGHVLLLDPHAEYVGALGDRAKVLDLNNLQLPFWLLNFEEMAEIMVGSSGKEAEAEIAILKEAILTAKKIAAGDSGETTPISIDTPVPYTLMAMIQFIDKAAGKLDRPESAAPYLRLKNRLDALRADKRYEFMFPGLIVRDNMAAILSTLYSIPVRDKPVTIVDLSGVPSETMNVVVSVLSRMTFDFALLSDRALPVLLVCEEAHRYAPQNADAGFEPTKRGLARIAREGRKYGVSLCVVSQRPSELDAGILSQCNTIFALRMSNQSDRDFVGGAMTESALGLLDSLPSLRNAEAVVVGEGVPVPGRICFDDLPDDQRPLSATASFSGAWSSDVESGEFLNRIVARWRLQE